jgi:hypothetical protein
MVPNGRGCQKHLNVEAQALWIIPDFVSLAGEKLFPQSLCAIVKTKYLYSEQPLGRFSFRT